MNSNSWKNNSFIASWIAWKEAIRIIWKERVNIWEKWEPYIAVRSAKACVTNITARTLGWGIEVEENWKKVIDFQGKTETIQDLPEVDLFIPLFDDNIRWENRRTQNAQNIQHNTWKDKNNIKIISLHTCEELDNASKTDDDDEILLPPEAIVKRDTNSDINESPLEIEENPLTLEEKYNAYIQSWTIQGEEDDILELNDPVGINIFAKIIKDISEICEITPIQRIKLTDIFCSMNLPKIVLFALNEIINKAKEKKEKIKWVKINITSIIEYAIRINKIINFSDITIKYLIRLIRVNNEEKHPIHKSKLQLEIWENFERIMGIKHWHVYAKYLYNNYIIYTPSKEQLRRDLSALENISIFVDDEGEIRDILKRIYAWENPWDIMEQILKAKRMNTNFS